MSRLVVVSNRVEVAGKKQSGVGGLAVSIQAALGAHGGIWFGWSGEHAAKVSGKLKIKSENNVTYATLDLTTKDYEQYYSGHANRAIWPTFHYRLDKIKFHRDDYIGYQRVNARFAEKLAPILQDDDLIWVHDFHLIPLARELRRNGQKQPIGFFLHIPFPAPEILTALPGHQDLVEGLCAYDVVGFQTKVDLHAFHSYIRQTLQGKTLSNGTIKVNGRTFFAGVFPVGIDMEDVAALAEDSKKSITAKKMEESLHGRPMIIGVDRLDYSKGIIARFHAFEHLLEMEPSLQEKCLTLIQIAPLSRSNVEEYRDLQERVSTTAGRINGRFSEYNWVPIRYINRGFKRRTLMGFFRASQVGLVTPLRDGMNLVAKEYVAAQDPENPGVLVLSRFAGAAYELNAHALIVNPYNAEAVADAIKCALSMPLDERKARWSGMIKTLRRNDITTWREKFVSTLQKVSGSAS